MCKTESCQSVSTCTRPLRRLDPEMRTMLEIMWIIYKYTFAAHKVPSTPGNTNGNDTELQWSFP